MVECGEGEVRNDEDVILPTTDRCPREGYVALRAAPNLDTRPPRLARRMLCAAG